MLSTAIRMAILTCACISTLFNRAMTSMNDIFDLGAGQDFLLGHFVTNGELLQYFCLPKLPGTLAHRHDTSGTRVAGGYTRRSPWGGDSLVFYMTAWFPPASLRSLRIHNYDLAATV
ncbi:hypothetical protein F5Y12DRAFT_733875 [Xylaria sp. FL1777]|nr:hypothetical protein F5Y12DRAFT_733875 [Xylaria sp. FL1777]